MCAAWALSCVLAVFGWQWLTVRYNFGGNWSALFYTSGLWPVPPALAFENIYQFPNSNGWDGQFYHIMAHDPFLRTDQTGNIDAPRLRYRRILLPALASLLAAGKSYRIDNAYRFAILLFVFAGAYWLARIAQSSGRSPAWGLAFALIPGAIVSIDRMGIDVVLAALCLGFACYSRSATDAPAKASALFGILVLAGLSRDTGLLLTAGLCLSLLIRRQLGRAILFSAAGAPTLAWYLYINSRTAPYPFDGTIAIPFAGVMDRLAHPMEYPFGHWLSLWMKSLDALAVGGILLAFGLAAAAAQESLESGGLRDGGVCRPWHCSVAARRLAGGVRLWTDTLAASDVAGAGWIGLRPMGGPSAVMFRTAAVRNADRFAGVGRGEGTGRRAGGLKAML